MQCRHGAGSCSPVPCFQQSTHLGMQPLGGGIFCGERFADHQRNQRIEATAERAAKGAAIDA